MTPQLIASPARQSGGLRETGHRPWPLPEESWLQGQTWETLLFAHWRVPVEEIREHVPDQLQVDVRDGSAWVGVTPFRVSGLRLRGTLPLPLVSSFLELNVRTYVTWGKRPGIWFFSLDAASRWAVAAARRSYRLPYHPARMRMERRDGWIEYSSSRDGAGRPHVFEGLYRPAGEVFQAEPESLEHFLTERYCLYTVGEGGGLATADIHHPPWPLQAAEAEIGLNTMAPEGIELAGEPLLHFAERQDVVIWPLRAA
jgi:uncharacterized protein YqjF (DUF2071 family)